MPSVLSSRSHDPSPPPEPLADTIVPLVAVSTESHSPFLPSPVNTHHYSSTVNLVCTAYIRIYPYHLPLEISNNISSASLCLPYSIGHIHKSQVFFGVPEYLPGSLRSLCQVDDWIVSLTNKSCTVQNVHKSKKNYGTPVYLPEYLQGLC